MRIPRICSVENCNSKHYCKSFCIKHYHRFRKYGGPTKIYKAPVIICRIENCNNKIHGLGLCAYHRDVKWRKDNPLYGTWQAMKARCYRKTHPRYADWGGRGIRVCDRWKNSYKAFAEDMGERPEGMTLDRIDNDGNYEPSNCRWATIQQQNSNKRRYRIKQKKREAV